MSGPIFLGGLCPGWSLSRGSLSRGVSVQVEVSVQGWVSVQGVSVREMSGKSPDRDPPYGEERAVRILLEYCL